ncbi:MAG: GNAT family N-acetyltransferase [Terriglobales bacterium]
MLSSVALIPHAVLEALPVSVRVSSATEVLAECGAYRVRLAMDDDDRRCLYRLRFLVFNLELNEGLDASYLDGMDRDQFDTVCDHLMVEHRESGRIVGTYRLQTGDVAGRHFGYYSAQEFDFAPYEALRPEVVECGRACIHREFRSFEVLNLLWRGVALYAVSRGARYLIGCSSVTSQDTAHGSAMYYRLQNYLVPPELQTVPTEAYGFELEPEQLDAPQPPKLLRAYLTVGAKICGPPALDREFKTIDFLTLLDLENMAPSARARYLR